MNALPGTDRNVRRLGICLAIQAAVIVFGLLALWMYWMTLRAQDGFRVVRAFWKGDTLYIRSASDGPYMVTALAHYSSDEGNKSTATISPPLHVIDSLGTRIEKAEYIRLTWRSITSEKVPGPGLHSQLVALYCPLNRSR